MKSITSIFQTFLDRFIALILLMVTLPLLLISMVALRICSEAPVIFKEGGETEDGIQFHRYRLRTKGRESYTFLEIGRQVRHFQADLLPGLWSVVIGDIGLKTHLGFHVVR